MALRNPELHARNDDDMLITVACELASSMHPHVRHVQTSADHVVLPNLSQ